MSQKSQSMKSSTGNNNQFVNSFEQASSFLGQQAKRLRNRLEVPDLQLGESSSAISVVEQDQWPQNSNDNGGSRTMN